METYFVNLDSQNVVVKVHLVTHEFLVANPERYTGIWVETFIDDTHTFGNIGFTYDYDTQDFTPPPAPEPVEP